MTGDNVIIRIHIFGVQREEGNSYPDLSSFERWMSQSEDLFQKKNSYYSLESSNTKTEFGVCVWGGEGLKTKIQTKSASKYNFEYYHKILLYRSALNHHMKADCINQISVKAVCSLDIEQSVINTICVIVTFAAILQDDIL